MALTARQRAFVDAYAGNATEAAIKAGYSEKTARSMGQQLLTKIDIASAIHEREEKRRNALIMSREERMMTLSEIARCKSEKAQDRTKAIDVLNKMSGEYLERVKVETNEGVTFKWQE